MAKTKNSAKSAKAGKSNLTNGASKAVAAPRRAKATPTVKNPGENSDKFVKTARAFNRMLNERYERGEIDLV